MARTTTDGLVQPSIDAILRSLADRPNVEATLILSRKDGSIIKATGFAAIARDNENLTSTNYSSQRLQENNELSSDIEKTNNEETVRAAGGGSPSPAEVLADSVYRYVDAASGLANTVTLISAPSSEGENNFTRRPSQNLNAEATDGRQYEADTSQHISDLQLLRLRTLQHEVIIFPDPRYLCCVVQRASKQGLPATTR